MGRTTSLAPVVPRRGINDSGLGTTIGRTTTLAPVVPETGINDSDLFPFPKIY